MDFVANPNSDADKDTQLEGQRLFNCWEGCAYDYSGLLNNARNSNVHAGHDHQQKWRSKQSQPNNYDSGSAFPSRQSTPQYHSGNGYNNGKVSPSARSTQDYTSQEPKIQAYYNFTTLAKSGIGISGRRQEEGITAMPPTNSIAPYLMANAPGT